MKAIRNREGISIRLPEMLPSQADVISEGILKAMRFCGLSAQTRGVNQCTDDYSL